MREGGLGLPGGHRRQGFLAARDRQDLHRAGHHPHGQDHHERDGPRGLSGDLWLRPLADGGPESPHGRHLRQHPRCAGGGGEDGHEAPPRERDLGTDLRPPGRRDSERHRRREEKTHRRAGERLPVLRSVHHPPGCPHRVRSPGERDKARERGASAGLVCAAGLPEAHRPDGSGQRRGTQPGAGGRHRRVPAGKRDRRGSLAGTRRPMAGNNGVRPGPAGAGRPVCVLGGGPGAGGPVPGDGDGGLFRLSGGVFPAGDHEAGLSHQGRDALGTGQGADGPGLCL